MILGGLLDNHDPGPDLHAYGAVGWDVGMLKPLSKDPATRHGVLDFTTDPAELNAMLRRFPKGNIGGRVPDGCLVLDVDPRSGGLASLDQLEARCGKIHTLTCWSGRGDGGRHFYLRHPGGKVTSRNLPPGIDLKTPAGYCLLPSSLHPDTGKPYWWEDPQAPIAEMHPALAVLLQPVVPRVPHVDKRRGHAADDESIADWYSANFTVGEVLRRANWEQLDDDGTRWRHPTATSALSATVKHGCLFTYSTNTPFEPTAAGDPHGATPFRVFAVLEHGGDLAAAARAARAIRDDVRISN